MGAVKYQGERGNRRVINTEEGYLLNAFDLYHNDDERMKQKHCAQKSQVCRNPYKKFLMYN